MSNRLEQLLSFWNGEKDNHEWVLATIVETQGSSYRKSGAMMVINSLGQYQGILSGGCLEPDLLRQARKCLADNQNTFVTYDSSDDNETAWQLGLGCGGVVKILLQPINKQNQYLHLDRLLSKLKNKQHCFYSQKLNTLEPTNTLSTATQLSAHRSEDIVEHYFKPSPVLCIFGGGIDARPVVEMANSLGWESYVIEDRVAFAKPQWFPFAKGIYTKNIDDVSNMPWFQLCDGIVIMTHSVKKDARALIVAQQSNAKYVGMLGPLHRTEKVFTEANTCADQLTLPLSTPIGLDIGGDIPESIALSILAEIHAVLEQKLVINHGDEAQNASFL